MELINEEAAMFDSLLMDSYVSSTTGVRPLHVLQVDLGSTGVYRTETGQFSSSGFADSHAKFFLPWSSFVTGQHKESIGLPR